MFKVDHNVYHYEGVTDLQVAREQAGRLLKGDMYKGPETTVIHLHGKQVDCDQFNEDLHIFYLLDHVKPEAIEPSLDGSIFGGSIQEGVDY